MAGRGGDADAPGHGRICDQDYGANADAKAPSTPVLSNHMTNYVEGTNLVQCQLVNKSPLLRTSTMHIATQADFLKAGPTPIRVTTP